MNTFTVFVSTIAIALAGTAFAGEGHTPRGVPRLNHVFVIMMENHGYGQIVNNPNAPFINSLAKSANSANSILLSRIRA